MGESEKKILYSPALRFSGSPILRLSGSPIYDPDAPVLLSVLRADTSTLQALDADQPYARILRSVLMHPDHEHHVDPLFRRVEEWAP